MTIYLYFIYTYIYVIYLFDFYSLLIVYIYIIINSIGLVINELPTDMMRDVRNSEFVKFLGCHRDLMNQEEHNELRRRLILHLWDHRDERDNEE